MKAAKALVIGKGKDKDKKAVKPGKVLPLKYEVTWDIVDGGPERSRNTFQCKHYCRARTAIRKRYPDVFGEDLKATCAFYHDEAGKLWDKIVKG